MSYYKTCYYCKHFEGNPDSKYYSYCLRDNKNPFEIQSMYAQYCHYWEARNFKILEIIKGDFPKEADHEKPA